MCQFIETIRIVDGVVMNLSYHQKRVDRTLAYLQTMNQLSLHDVIDSREQEFGTGIQKLRIVYGAEGIQEVSVSPYQMRRVNSFKLVVCDDIEYSFKGVNRDRLNALRNMKGDADEIIIVKHGLLTDTSYSNIALFDGKEWVTPQTPLLKGTMRQSLLDQGIITERRISVEDVSLYQKIAMINAMLPLGACVADITSSSLRTE